MNIHRKRNKLNKPLLSIARRMSSYVASILMPSIVAFLSGPLLDFLERKDGFKLGGVNLEVFLGNNDVI